MNPTAALPIPSVGAGLSRYLTEIKKFPLLTPEEEFTYAKRWREHGDRDAAYRLVTSHLRLVALVELTCAVAMLISSGPDWTNRTKRWAARAPGLEIFTQAFVLRDKSGWQITEAGRALLASIEAPLPKIAPEEPSGAVVLLVRPTAARPPLQPAGTKHRRMRHRRRDGRRQHLGQ
ncbi:hypothetical protein JQ575_25915 [Bradyrhizobium sp. JYMT SZCCT0428]|nr:hypothetical protein [Bradyrhizobium sp. JYMT SZCCT0428]